MWSPVHPAIFAAVDGMGRLDLWNLNNDTEVCVETCEYRSLWACFLCHLFVLMCVCVWCPQGLLPGLSPTKQPSLFPPANNHHHHQTSTSLPTHTHKFKIRPWAFPTALNLNQTRWHLLITAPTQANIPATSVQCWGNLRTPLPLLIWLPHSVPSEKHTDVQETTIRQPQPSVHSPMLEMKIMKGESSCQGLSLSELWGKIYFQKGAFRSSEGKMTLLRFVYNK